MGHSALGGLGRRYAEGGDVSMPSPYAMEPQGQHPYETPPDPAQRPLQSLSPTEMKGLLDLVDSSAPKGWAYPNGDSSPYGAPDQKARGGLAHLAEGGAPDDPQGPTVTGDPIKRYGVNGAKKTATVGDILDQFIPGWRTAPDPKTGALPQGALATEAPAPQTGALAQVVPYQQESGLPGYARGGAPHGGALAATGNAPVAQGHTKGPGGGQDDLIEAKLSDGEFVVSADVVSALGDGSNDHGAKKLDGMMNAVRKHKAVGEKFPPKAKPPLAYIKGGKKMAEGGPLSGINKGGSGVDYQKGRNEPAGIGGARG